MNLDLTDDEIAALRKLLRHQALGSTEPKRADIDGERFSLSPRIRPFRAILAKIDDALSKPPQVIESQLTECLPAEKLRISTEVALEKIMVEVINPYETDIWEIGEILTIAAVQQAIEQQRYETIPFDGGRYLNKTEQGIDDPTITLDPNYDHAARVAHLIVHPVDDPILVRVNDILGDAVEILDGCHRIAAAIYKKQATMMVDYQGSQEGFTNWLRQPRRFLQRHGWIDM